MIRPPNLPFAAAQLVLSKTCRGSICHATSSGTVPRVLRVTRVMCRGCTCSLPAIASYSSNCSPLTIATRCSGIEPLIDLLFGSDIACQVRRLRATCHTTRLTFSQVCASGALLNCIGPSLSPVFEHPRRRALRKVELGGWGAVMSALA